MSLFKLLLGAAVIGVGAYIALRASPKKCPSCPAAAAAAAEPAGDTYIALPGPVPEWAQGSSDAQDDMADSVADDRAIGLIFRELLTHDELVAWNRIPWMPDHSLARFTDRDELDAWWDKWVATVIEPDQRWFGVVVSDADVLKYSDEIWSRRDDLV